jgi:hypothetical protein
MNIQVSAADLVFIARTNAAVDAREFGVPIAFGLQTNDDTGDLESGHVPEDYADRPGMLHEVHGIVAPDGTVTERTDKVPAWRK